MSQRDERGQLYGLLKVENEAHKFAETKYFELDLTARKLKLYYDHPKNLPKTSCTPCEEMDLNMIAKVSDARNVKPKGGYCFCITYTGNQIYVQANNEAEMFEWIEQLNDACRIIINDAVVKTLAPQNSCNEVAGGVIISTQPSVKNMEHNNMTALSLPSVMSGYAVKQGAVRKNWKKRYFVLDSNGLSYFRHDQDKVPIKTISLAKINKAKLVPSDHHKHRQNLFEVITDERVFNVHCDSPTESERWVEQINSLAKSVFSSNLDKSNSIKTKSLAQAPTQEEIKLSKAVWSDKCPQPGDRRSKSSLRVFKKSWPLW